MSESKIKLWKFIGLYLLSLVLVVAAVVMNLDKPSKKHASKNDTNLEKQQFERDKFLFNLEKVNHSFKELELLNREMLISRSDKDALKMGKIQTDIDKVIIKTHKNIQKYQLWSNDELHIEIFNHLEKELEFRKAYFELKKENLYTEEELSQCKGITVSM